MSLIMYDAVTWQNMPGGAYAYCGYVDGYRNWPDVVATWNGRAHLLPITVDGNYAACADYESGAMSVGMADGWTDSMLKQGVWRPAGYAALSTWESGLWNALDHYGSSVRRIVADWNGQYDVPAGFDAHQLSTNGYDTSVCLPSMFATAPPPPPPPPADPEHYDLYEVGPFHIVPFGELNERQVVEDYDGARKQPHKYGNYLNYDLRPRLKDLAGRIATVAHAQLDKDGLPSWNVDSRGFRFQGTIKRSTGASLT